MQTDKVSVDKQQHIVTGSTVPEQEVCHIQGVPLPMSLCHYALKHIQPAVQKEL